MVDAGCGMDSPIIMVAPPNAIVFGSGYLPIPQMVRAGIYPNVISIGLLTSMAQFRVPLLLK